IERGVWVAVRAFGQRSEARNLRVAHSSPIFVTVDDTGFVRKEALPQLVARQRQLLAELVNSPVDPMGDLEPWETKATLVEQYQRQLDALKPRIEEADRRYLAMLGSQGQALLPLVVPLGWPTAAADSKVTLFDVSLMVLLACAALSLRRVPISGLGARLFRRT